MLCLLRLHHRFQVDQRRFDIAKEPCCFPIDRFKLNAPVIQRFIPSYPENEGTIDGLPLCERRRCVCHGISIVDERSENVAMWLRMALRSID